VTHLTSKQIHEWTIGERNREAARHLEACRACRDEIVTLQDGIQAFRNSVHRLASLEITTATAKSSTSHRAPYLSWRWATAVALSVGFALFPLYLDRSSTAQEEQTAQDSQLLNQINARLSQTVPQPMEPLMKLMNDAEGDSQ
jgi:hypothetical protein